MAPTVFADKAKPTNRDLQVQVQELHECLHQVGDKVATNGIHVSMLAAGMGVRLPSAEEIAAGVQPQAVRRRLGGMDPWHVALAAIGAMSGAQVLYKILEPTIVAAAVALHGALIH